MSLAAVDDKDEDETCAIVSISKKKEECEWGQARRVFIEIRVFKEGGKLKREYGKHG